MQNTKQAQGKRSRHKIVSSSAATSLLHTYRRVIVVGRTGLMGVPEHLLEITGSKAKLSIGRGATEPAHLVLASTTARSRRGWAADDARLRGR